MVLVDALNTLFSLNLVYAAILATLLVHFVPWAIDPRGIRSIPGPFLAKFSDAWLGQRARASL